MDTVKDFKAAEDRKMKEEETKTKKTPLESETSTTDMVETFDNVFRTLENIKHLNQEIRRLEDLLQQEHVSLAKAYQILYGAFIDKVCSLSTTAQTDSSVVATVEETHVVANEEPNRENESKAMEEGISATLVLEEAPPNVEELVVEDCKKPSADAVEGNEEQVGLEDDDDIEIISPPPRVISIVDLTEGISSDDENAPTTEVSAPRRSARLAAHRRRIKFEDHV